MNGINRDMIIEHNKKFWTFRNFMTLIEGFNSIGHYKKWLAEMDSEQREKVNNYYIEKYNSALKIAE